MKRICLALGALSVSALSYAQVSFTGSPYSQNFDTLAASGSNVVWTDNSTLSGWYMKTINDPNTVLTSQYQTGTGSSATGALYSFGSAGSAERALGSVGSGTVEHAKYGVRLQNDASVAFMSITISYRGEQWRNGGPTVAAFHSLLFSYDVSAGGAGSIGNDTQLLGGAANYVADPNYTAVSSLNFTGPIGTTTAAALDGNAAGNFTPISATFTFSGELWDPGEDLWIRWVDLNDVSNDHGLAIDNVVVEATPVPEPATMTALALGAVAMMRKRRIRR